MTVLGDQRGEPVARGRTDRYVEQVKADRQRVDGDGVAVNATVVGHVVLGERGAGAFGQRGELRGVAVAAEYPRRLGHGPRAAIQARRGDDAVRVQPAGR